MDLLDGRLLLGCAVEGTEPNDKVRGIDRNDHSVRVLFLKDPQGGRIGAAVAKLRDDDDPISQVVIAVALGNPSTLDHPRWGSPKGNDLEFAIFRIGRFSQNLVLLGQVRSVGVVGGRRYRSQHDRRSDESHELIDVAIGVITGQFPAVDPEHLLNAEHPLELSFDLFVAPVGVSCTGDDRTAGR